MYYYISKNHKKQGENKVKSVRGFFPLRKLTLIGSLSAGSDTPGFPCIFQGRQRRAQSTPDSGGKLERMLLGAVLRAGQGQSGGGDLIKKFPG
jgi:hypothetical protein